MKKNKPCSRNSLFFLIYVSYKKFLSSLVIVAGVRFACRTALALVMSARLQAGGKLAVPSPMTARAMAQIGDAIFDVVARTTVQARIVVARTFRYHYNIEIHRNYWNFITIIAASPEFIKRHSLQADFLLAS
uniref:Uncharacterized protein n=1 Tax=Romanomermis culicivorax TaxID=13658 RepID=A0A915IKW5_ROMCU